MNSFGKLYCRAFQTCLKVGNYFLGYRTPEVQQGPGSVKRLPEFIRSLGITNVLVVTDAGLMKLGLPQPMLDAMDAAGVSCTVYDGVCPNPTSDNVEEGLRIYLENDSGDFVTFLELANSFFA